MIRLILPTGFIQSQIKVDKGLINYLRAGNGPDVIVLDEVPGASTELYRLLSENYCLTVITGTANSDIPFDSTCFVEMSTEASNQFAPKGYALLGMSFFAAVAIRQALNDSDNVEALILVSPLAILPAEDPQLITAPNLTDILTNSPGGDSLLDLYCAGNTSQLIERFRTLSDEDRIQDSLANINSPTLAVFGVEDKMISPEAARVYKKIIPNCNISLIYAAGHLIGLDRPDSLANVVTDFIQYKETFIVGRESSEINP